MSTAILTDYDNLYINDGNTDFTIVTASPNPKGSTKIKRWWNSSYEKVTYVSCALIEISDSYIVVDCDKDARLKMVKGDDSLSFSVGFDEPGDGNINRILVCPKSELHALTNYDDYYYDYNTKQLKHIQYGTGGITLAPAHITYTISNSGTTFTLRSSGTVDYTVDWGDGSAVETVSSANDTDANAFPHTYPTTEDPVSYIVKVNSSSGVYRPYFNNSGDEDQITSIAIGTDDSAVIGTSLQRAYKGANNMTQYTQPFSATSAVTTFREAWNGCSSLTSFPLIDTSSVTSFGFAWSQCSGLTAFPALDISNATNVGQAWNGCSNLVAFPSVDFSSVTNSFRRTWYLNYQLTTFPANQFDNIGTITNTNAFEDAWRNCALTAQSIENILTSLDTNGQIEKTLGIHGGQNANASTWSYDALNAYINLENKGWTINKNGNATGISYKITIESDGDSFNLKSNGTSDYDVDWGDGSSDTNQTSNISHTYTSHGTYVVKVTVNSGTYRPYYNYGTIGGQITEIAIGDSVLPLTVEKAFTGCTNVIKYNQISSATSAVTNFKSAFASFDVTSIQFIDVSSGTNFGGAWSNNLNLTAFPVLDVSNGTNFSYAFKGLTSITSFPVLNFSSGTNFQNAWGYCELLTSFPALPTSNRWINATTFKTAWRDNDSLSTFPANMFDTTGSLAPDAFDAAWIRCALTAQSIENILVSLDTNNQSGKTLGIDGGTNATASTWSYDALTAYIKLRNKGWTINKNGHATDISYKITIANDGDSFTLRSTGTVNYDVDWGDGSAVQTVTSADANANALAHTYESDGTYTIKVNSNSGVYRIRYNQSGDEDQITSIAIGTDDSALLGNNLHSAFKGANNMTEYNQVFSATSACTQFYFAWSDCSSLTSFPLIDLSSAVSFSFTWEGCSGLTSFPALDFSNATGVGQAWRECSSLISFPSVDFSSVTNSFRRTWYYCTSLTTFPANQFDNIGTITDTNAFQEAWHRCALTAQSIENILTSLDTNNQSGKTLGIDGGTNATASTWSYDALNAYINLENKGWTINKRGDATDISYKITIANDGDSFTLSSDGTVNYTVDWGDGNSESSTSNTLDHEYTSSGTYTIKVNSNSGTYRPYYVSGTQITSIAIGTDDPTVLGTNLYRAFRLANLTEYNQVASASSSVTDFGDTWRGANELETLSIIDASSGTSFVNTWRDCYKLITFPSLPSSNRFTSATTFVNTWRDCTLLRHFPANLFDSTGNLAPNAFSNAFKDCALTAQSIENILTSLDTNGTSNITLGIHGGTNAAYSTWSTAAQTAFANLSGDPTDPSDTGKGWTITYNTTSGTATNP